MATSPHPLHHSQQGGEDGNGLNVLSPGSFPDAGAHFIFRYGSRPCRCPDRTGPVRRTRRRLPTGSC